MPVVAIGGQETALFLGRGERLSRALRLDRLIRLKVLPIQVAPPFGMTLLDLPGRIPLPSQITIEVLRPRSIWTASETILMRRPSTVLSYL